MHGMKEEVIPRILVKESLNLKLRGEDGRAPRPFIRLEGERGGRTGKGIGRPVAAASMPAVRFGGEGK
jgi:hypothetical protein